MAELKRLASVKLTSKIEFSEIGDTLIMVMGSDSINENMQSDEAAFEAWALVGKANGYSKVRLEVDSLSETDDKRPHHNRFLYRALRFSENFDWFELSSELVDKSEQFSCNYLKSGRLVYNVPTQDAKETAENKEAIKERELISDSKKTNEMLNTKVKNFYSQLPVGLFDGEKSASTAVFPRGSAAIDIWGLENDTIHLIELKADGNKRIGVLSELFFYVSFMFDVYCKDLAKPSENSEKRGFEELMKNKANIKKINGYIVLSEKHPQLEGAFNELQKCKEKDICFKNIVVY